MITSVQRGELVSLNVGTPTPYDWLGREVVTAIRKSPVTGASRAARRQRRR